MAGVFVTASSRFLEVDAAPVTAASLTMACWFNVTNITANHVLMFVGNLGLTADFFLMRAAGNISGDPIEFIARRGTEAKAASPTGFSANTWHHACGVEVSSTSRFAYIDGSIGTEETTEKTPAGANRTSIGRVGDFTPGGYADGLIAEVALWNIAFTADDVAMLAAGYSPLMVRPEGLVFYSPLIRTLTNDLVGGLTLTNNNGVTVGNHPRIIYPHRKHIRRYGVAVAPPAPTLFQRTLTGVGI